MEYLLQRSEGSQSICVPLRPGVPLTLWHSQTWEREERVRTRPYVTERVLNCTANNGCNRLALHYNYLGLFAKITEIGLAV